MDSPQNSILTLPLVSRRTLLNAGMLLGGPMLVGSRVASAQGTPETDTSPVRGGTLRVGVQGDPAALDPHLSILDAGATVFDFVYEGLVRLNSALEPEPALAESWTISPDGLVYTFAMRSGVAFHNGRAVEAADVVYSIERVRDPETASPDVAHTDSIASIVAPDARSVVFTLSSPDASFLSRLSRSGLAVVPKEVVEENGDLQLTMVGTGPFVFNEYIPNTGLSFTRNQTYWNPELPYVDALEVLIIPVDTSRTTALISGTVDLIQQVPHADIPKIEAESELALAGELATNLRWIVFNLQRPPFDNLALRQAIAQAIDREAIIASAVFGYGTPLVGMYPGSFWAGYEGEVPVANPEAARGIIEDLALPSDFKPKILTFADYQFLAATSTVVQEQLRLVGIESELEPQDNATYLDNLFSGNFDIAVMGASGYSDPSEYLKAMLGTGEFTNPGKYSNPALDQLIVDGLVAQDRTERIAIYQQAQQIVIDDLPIISLYTSNTYEGLHRDVIGYEHSLTGRIPGVRSAWFNR